MLCENFYLVCDFCLHDYDFVHEAIRDGVKLRRHDHDAVGVELAL